MAQLQSDLDGEIHQFFAGQSATRAECDDLARTTFGGLVEPVAVQGATSYTVVAGQNRDKIVQFRSMDAQLDMTMLALARHVHGDVVPAGAALGQIGSDAQKQLAIYEMDRLPGDNYALVRASLAEEPQRHFAAVHGLARLVERFVAFCFTLAKLKFEIKVLCAGLAQASGSKPASCLCNHYGVVKQARSRLFLRRSHRSP